MEQYSSVLPYSELVGLDQTLWILTAPTGISNFDFRFESYFPCRRTRDTTEQVVAISRIGAIQNYDHVFSCLKEEGIALVHSPEVHLRASELIHWYPFLKDLTPKSLWSDDPLDSNVIATELGWPIFLKGSRQTSRHRRSLSIIEGPEQFARVMETYSQDPILRWQKMVYRQFVPLRLVEEAQGDRLVSSFEFRTFWWRGELAGFGRYWWEGKPYQATSEETQQGLKMAREAAIRLSVPFLVVDIAQAADGRWLVIECNDGQESGYAAVTPIALWQRILEIEKELGAANCREK